MGLIFLNDTAENRAAAVQHLQTFAEYFAGADAHYFKRLSRFAEGLGGQLEPPRLSRKYAPLEKALGARTARNAMRNWRAAKLLARRNWDLCLHRAGL